MKNVFRSHYDRSVITIHDHHPNSVHARQLKAYLARLQKMALVVDGLHAPALEGNLPEETGTLLVQADLVIFDLSEPCQYASLLGLAKKYRRAILILLKEGQRKDLREKYAYLQNPALYPWRGAILSYEAFIARPEEVVQVFFDTCPKHCCKFRFDARQKVLV